MLRAHEVACVLDVRAFPSSRRMPHFGRDQLEPSLTAAGIGYAHLPELGGRRKPAADSVNGGWRKDSFRAYADHMASEEFQSGLERAEALAREQRSAIMCAEALWWRCHRRLVADALTVDGWRVWHVVGDAAPARHELTDFAVVAGGRVTYPPPQEALEV